jgi:hypothetical protein
MKKRRRFRFQLPSEDKRWGNKNLTVRPNNESREELRVCYGTYDWTHCYCSLSYLMRIAVLKDEIFTYHEKP